MTQQNPAQLQSVLTRSDKTFNFAACLIDSIGWPLGIAFFSQTTILPLLLQHLGASNTEIGALPAIYNLLVFLPGFLVIRTLSRRPRIRSFLFGVALIERFPLLPLAWLTPLWGVSHPSWLIDALFALIIVHALAMGFNQPAYWAIIGKIIPAHWRGRLFGYAGGLGGLLSIGMERVLRHLLSGPNGGFPAGYGQGFLIGFLLLTISVLPLGMVREPISEPADDDPHSGHYGRDCLRVWREHHDFRRFLYGQAAMTMASIATPFYVLYAERHLHATIGTVAGYTGVLVLTTAFGGLLWGAWADRVGNKYVLLGAGASLAFAAVWALVSPSALLYYGVFIATALSAAGQILAGNNIVMEYAGPPRNIPLYSALYNGVTAVPRAAAPLVGGLVADAVHGYSLTFILSGLLALVGLGLTLRATDPRQSR